MSRSTLETIYVAFIGVVAVVISMLIATAVVTTSAQDTAPAWEYAALVYEGETGFVFTDDLDANSELNAQLMNMGDDFNLIRSMNLMGSRGWQFVDAQPAGAGVTLYLFERAG